MAPSRFAALGIAVASTVLAERADASCVATPFADRMEYADLVFRGTVVDRGAECGFDCFSETFFETYYVRAAYVPMRWAVDEVYKGSVSRDAVVVAALTEYSGPFARPTAGEWLVFARYSESLTAYVYGDCSFVSSDLYDDEIAALDGGVPLDDAGSQQTTCAPPMTTTPPASLDGQYPFTCDALDAGSPFDAGPEQPVDAGAATDDAGAEDPVADAGAPAADGGEARARDAGPDDARAGCAGVRVPRTDAAAGGAFAVVVVIASSARRRRIVTERTADDRRRR